MFLFVDGNCEGKFVMRRIFNISPVGCASRTLRSCGAGDPPARSAVANGARCFKDNFAGGSPAAAYFLLCGQEKVSKEKAAPVRRSGGLPCAARHAGRLRNSPLSKNDKGSDSL